MLAHAAIYRGEARHGVTVHRMESGVDTGPIAFAEDFPLTKEDTGLTVALRCARKGVDLVGKIVEILARDPGQLELTPQDLTQRRYFALTGQRCDAAPGTVRDGNLVATADEWLLLKKWK
jgi:methionyl-tRNA formyltransferase